MGFLSGLWEALGLDKETRQARIEARTERKAKRQEERTERVEARQETRQVRAEQGSSFNDVLMQPLNTVETLGTGALNVVAENPELAAAGLALAGGPAGAIGSSLLGALGGGGSSSSQPATVVQQDSMPTWLPWAVGGIALTGLGVAVASGRKK